MTPYYADESVTLHHGDCLDVMRELPDNSVDAICTDPPYGLGFMGQKWDTYANESGRAKSTKAHKFDHVGGNHNPSNAADAARTKGVESRRFGAWCEPWTKEALRVLKPGGHLLAFGGTRTWHRLAVAIEDAGFEVRDNIAWLYGSGFPKSLDVSKAIDKRPGVQRHPEFAAALRAAMAAKGYTNTFDVAEAVIGRRTGAVANWQKYQWPEAKWWPALRDLLDMDEAKWGPVVAEAERERIGTRTTGKGTGKGAVAYIADGANDAVTAPTTPAAQQWQGWGTALKPAFEPIVVARKPLAGTVAGNVLAHGTGALNVDGCRVATTEALHGSTVRNDIRGGQYGSGHRAAEDLPAYEQKAAGRWPTNVLLDGSQADELDRQSGTLTSGALKPYTERHENASSFRMEREKTYEKAADSGGASRFFPTFRYEAKAPTAERPRHGEVAHPTVKPLDLMRWLVRLVTPPGGTVLEPFAGSGTTAEACVIEGFRCIAIEREAVYLPLIVARLSKPIQPDLFGGAA